MRRGGTNSRRRDIYIYIMRLCITNTYTYHITLLSRQNLLHAHYGHVRSGGAGRSQEGVLIFIQRIRGKIA